MPCTLVAIESRDGNNPFCVDLRPNVGIDHLQRWLERHTARNPGLRLELADGTPFSLRPVEPLRETSSGTRLLHVDYLRIVKQWHSSEAEPTGTLLWFELEPLDAGRVRMSLACVHKAVEQHAKRLLADLGEDYPAVKGPSKATEPAEVYGLAPKREPWEAIPEGWRREAVKMWWSCHDQGEIAKKLGYETKYIATVFWELRKAHGADIVPTKQEMLRLRLQKSGM